jgi:hypothetical protein
VPPAPYRHFRNTERARRRSVAAKGHFEREVMLTAGEPTFEARWSYCLGTRWHGACQRWLCDPISRNEILLPTAVPTGCPNGFQRFCRTAFLLAKSHPDCIPTVCSFRPPYPQCARWSSSRKKGELSWPIHSPARGFERHTTTIRWRTFEGGPNCSIRISSFSNNRYIARSSTDFPIPFAANILARTTGA